METSWNNLFSRSVVHNFLYHEEKFTAADTQAPRSVVTFYYKFKMHKSFV